ncbi:MAG: DUF5681 domain-containing protein [Pseudomonadota bacterium]
MSKKHDNEHVGYGKPPKHSRFKKGQSGNRKGRPKGSLNFKTELREVLNESVTVTQKGKPKKVTARMAAILRLREQALKGDHRAIDRFLQLADRLQDEDMVAEARRLTSGDQEILNRFLEAQSKAVSTATSQTEEGRGDVD